MPPKIQIWTKERENVLIFEVERRPMLWDVSSEGYKRVDLKSSQWYEIAKILGPSFSADMVQHRFTSIKQTFMANYRKERESKERCSGKSPDEIFKPKWVLYNRLKFLKKSCAQATSQSNLPPYSSCSESLTANISETIECLNNDVTDVSQYNLDNTQQYYVISDNVPEDYNSDHTSDITSCATNSLTDSLSSPGYESQSNNSILQPTATVSSVNYTNLQSTSHNKENLYLKRGTNKKRKGTLVEEALGAVKTLASQPTKQNDSAEYFGNFIGAKLREMSPSSRRSCEQEILKCLANY